MKKNYKEVAMRKLQFLMILIVMLSLSVGKLHAKSYTYSFKYVNDGKSSYVEINGEKKDLDKISLKDKEKIKRMFTEWKKMDAYFNRVFERQNRLFKTYLDILDDRYRLFTIENFFSKPLWNDDLLEVYENEKADEKNNKNVYFVNYTE